MDSDAANLLVRVGTQRFTVLDIDRESFDAVPELIDACHALDYQAEVPATDAASRHGVYQTFIGRFETDEGELLLAAEFRCVRVEQNFVRCAFCNLNDVDQFRLDELLGCVLDNVQSIEPERETAPIEMESGTHRNPVASKSNSWTLPVVAFVFSALGLVTFMPGGFADSWIRAEVDTEIQPNIEPDSQSFAAITSPTVKMATEFPGESYAPAIWVVADVPGKITELNFMPGQALTSGQVIAKIIANDPERSAQIKSTQMEWERAKSQLTEAEQLAHTEKKNRTDQRLLLEEKIRQGEERQARTKKEALAAIAMLDNLNSGTADTGTDPLPPTVKSGEDRVLAAKLAYTLATNDLTKLKASYFKWMESRLPAGIDTSPNSLLESARHRVKETEEQLTGLNSAETSTPIEAPAEGQVDTILKRVGEFTLSGERLLSIKPTQTWHAKFIVPSEVGKATRLDQSVSIRLVDSAVDIMAQVVELSNPIHVAKDSVSGSNIRSDDFTTVVVQWSAQHAPIPTGSPMYLRISTQ